ncbi:MAG TPA: hypothetical protein VMW45_01105 [Dehalococcoidia bacterium]|nr:hypothetical protein [Dehalococcoidia bacterium]
MSPGIWSAIVGKLEGKAAKAIRELPSVKAAATQKAASAVRARWGAASTLTASAETAAKGFGYQGPRALHSMVADTAWKGVKGLGKAAVWDGASRVATGAVVGGALGGLMSDSNTTGGTMQGVFAGAMLGAGAGMASNALLSKKMWKSAGKFAGNRILGGNALNKYKSGGVWAGMKASGTAWGKRLKGSGKMVGGAVDFVGRHPNLAATAAVGAIGYGVYSGGIDPSPKARAEIDLARQGLADTGIVRNSRENYLALESSTQGLVQGLNRGRHS